MKLNLGIDKLSKGFKDWNNILRKSNKSSQEYQEALANTKDAVSDLLSVDETFLSNEFIGSEETLTLLEEAANGSAEAIEKL
jgi:hypothetical protein